MRGELYVKGGRGMAEALDALVAALVPRHWPEISKLEEIISGHILQSVMPLSNNAFAEMSSLAASGAGL